MHMMPWRSWFGGQKGIEARMGRAPPKDRCTRVYIPQGELVNGLGEQEAGAKD